MSTGANRSLCDFTDKEIADLWRTHAHRYDDFADADAIRAEFLRNSVDDIGFSQAFRAIAQRREQDPHFFSRFHYGWVGSAAAYTHPVEAAFQVRLLDLLIPLFKATSELPSPEILGDLAVRETIVPATMHTTPTAENIEGHGFILLPLGWFDTLHYASASLRSLLEGNPGLTMATLKELILRSLVDNIVRELGLQRYVLHPALLAILKAGISRGISKQVAFFSDATGDLSPDLLSGVWSDLVYAATTFAIAHEAAHLLAGEHLRAAESANEFGADRLALAMLHGSERWQDILRSIPFRSPAGKTRAAALFFTFVNLVRLKTDRLYGTDHGAAVLKFSDRVAELDVEAKKLVLDEPEQKELEAFTQYARALLNGLDTLLAQITPSILAETQSAGLATGEELILEQRGSGVYAKR